MTVVPQKNGEENCGTHWNSSPLNARRLGPLNTGFTVTTKLNSIKTDCIGVCYKIIGKILLSLFHFV